jgi:hypothetical protein
VKWWKDFWSKSSVKLPDELIEKQYYLELYKLGSVSRKGAPAITLQAVWTADNGSLPPWKGDFHNDPEYSVELLASLYRKSFAGSGIFYRLVMEDKTSKLTVYQTVFRRRQAECSGSCYLKR